MSDIASIRNQLQQEDFKAFVVHLENLFMAYLLVTVGCCSLLVIGLTTWLSEGKGRVHERGQSWRADPKRNVALRRGESYPSSCATARPSIGAARTELHSTDKQSAPRSLAAPRTIASKPPLAPRPRSADTVGSKEPAVRKVLASISETSLLVASELAAPRRRAAVSPPTAGRRRGMPSEDDSSSRRQRTVSSAARFYAEVVNRQAALHPKSFPTLAKDIPASALSRRAKSEPF